MKLNEYTVEAYRDLIEAADKLFSKKGELQPLADLFGRAEGETRAAYARYMGLRLALASPPQFKRVTDKPEGLKILSAAYPGLFEAAEGFFTQGLTQPLADAYHQAPEDMRRGYATYIGLRLAKAQTWHYRRLMGKPEGLQLLAEVTTPVFVGDLIDQCLRNLSGMVQKDIVSHPSIQYLKQLPFDVKPSALRHMDEPDLSMIAQRCLTYLLPLCKNQLSAKELAEFGGFLQMSDYHLQKMLQLKI